MTFVRELDLASAHAGITARLTEQFERLVDAAVVEITVRQCAERFGNARIAQFVPVLVERRSIETLWAIVDAESSRHGAGRAKVS